MARQPENAVIISFSAVEQLCALPLSTSATSVQEFSCQTGDRVLASATLINFFELPSGITERPLGDLRLRGKEGVLLFWGKAQLQLEAHAAQYVARAIADGDPVVRALVE